MNITNKLIIGTSLSWMFALEPALAQQTADAEDDRTLDTVVVTGSLIAGAAETAALPIDVISEEELLKQGSPSALELIKSLPVSSGVLGDTNQFDARAQGSEGSGTVNLRGLGPQRTLVLYNGRRLPSNPFILAGAGAIDTNILPLAPVGRIEILKDGAAATYGSDAVAGVVNFITRKDFEGVEAGGSYKFVDGSNGEWDVFANFGWVGDDMNVLLSGAFQKRSELSTLDRDFVNLSFAENPEGGISLVGNPGAFLPVGPTFAPTAGVTRDPGCVGLGGFELQPTPTLPLCGFQFTRFDNLVEEQERFQLYGEFNASLFNDGVDFHLEGFYSETDVPQINFSPSFPPVGGASAPTADASLIPGQFFVPATNPGFISLAAQAPGSIPPGSIGAFLIATRPLGNGGNPFFEFPFAQEEERRFDAFRVSGELSGKLADVANWSFAVTYGEESGFRTNTDTIVNNFALALRGLGGENCNVAANTPGLNGCLFFNPFSTALPANAITGEANPLFNPAAANSLEVIDFFLDQLTTDQTQGLLVLDGLLSGELPLTLPGGAVGWAFGGQFRRDDFSSDISDNANLNINPCIDTVTTGNTSCAIQTGIFGFLTGSVPVSLDRNVYAFFGELNLPILENLTANAALRFEDYGGAVGSTVDPKLSLRYQPIDFLAFRGSVGTTFRGPSLTQVSPTTVTSLQNIGGTFRAVDITGNANLQPEDAFTYSVGSILEAGGFTATVDYWSFEFKDPIIAEPVSGLVGALFPAGLPNNCGNPAFAPIEARFTFTGACAIGNVSRLSTFAANGPDIDTSGIDVIANYTFEDLFGGDLDLGGSLTYVIDYTIGETVIEGVVVAPPLEAAGFLNFQTIATPLPEVKFETFANYSHGRHNVRWTVRFIGEYDDARFGPGALGDTIDSFVTNDLTYQIELPYNSTFTFSVDNIFDQDPSFTRLELAFDPFTGDPIGRTFKLAVRTRF